MHLSYSCSELSPFGSAEGVYVKETYLYNHPGANVTVTFTPPELGHFAAAPPWGWLGSAVSVTAGHLAVTQGPKSSVMGKVPQ